MKIYLQDKEITHLVEEATWSGNIKQAARKLEITLAQDDRDKRLPVVEFDNGYAVRATDDDGNVVFDGRVYELERDRKKSTAKLTCYDELFRLNKSKTTRKFADALPEDIARQICAEMNIQPGLIAETGVAVSFIANSKSGFQIISQAYDEAHKQNGKTYQLIMNGNELCVVEKGTTSGVELDSERNMTESIYRESIAELVNKVKIVDDKGNTLDSLGDDDSQNKYGTFQDVYKTDKQKDTQTEAKDKIKPPKREGSVTALGDYRARAGLSLIIKDSLFKGQFWIESDTHQFKNTYHEMRLTLDFERMTEGG